MEEKKSKMGIIIGVIVCILVLGVGCYFLFFNKPSKDNTTPPPADTPTKDIKESEKLSNKVLMECPEKVKASQEIECSIKMQYSESYHILSINANYSLNDGIKYVSFTSNCKKCDIDVHTENGFAIGSIDGLNNDWVVGKVKFSIPATVTSGKAYKIGLNNVEYSTHDYKMVSLSNVTTQITIE
jgi:hypothetical protein